MQQRRCAGGWTWPLVVLAAANLVAAGCSSTGADRSSDAINQHAAEVNERLVGDWRLVSFVPDSSLDPALGTLLAEHGGRMTIRFEEGHVRSTTPDVHFERVYRIEHREDRQFVIVILDDQGTRATFVCDFDRVDHLVFRSITEPWTGLGVLQREGASTFRNEE